MSAALSSAASSAARPRARADALAARRPRMSCCILIAAPCCFLSSSSRATRALLRDASREEAAPRLLQHDRLDLLQPSSSSRLTPAQRRPRAARRARAQALHAQRGRVEPAHVRLVPQQLQLVARDDEAAEARDRRRRAAAPRALGGARARPRGARACRGRRPGHLAPRPSSCRTRLTSSASSRPALARHVACSRVAAR